MNKLVYSIVLIISLITTACNSNNENTEHPPNAVVISLDGLRWQELFTGIDSVLVRDQRYTSDTSALIGQYWRSTSEDRRELLMPFFWSVIKSQGVLLGNRSLGNKVDCTNQLWFSYPGYNEILTGKADDEHITSNDKIPNPNVTFLEYLNKMPDYNGRVAAFGSWDVFPFIINEERSQVPVNAGYEQMEIKGSENVQIINKLQNEIPRRWGTVRFDAFTHNFMMEYLEHNRPRVVYIAYGETDDFAHDGDYDAYIQAANRTDSMIKELWDKLQSMDQYRDNTTLIITTDHGRGTIPVETWRSHGKDITGAGEIWLAALGQEVPALGEVSKSLQLYQNQVAATACEVLGVSYQDDAGASILSDLR